MKAPKRLKELPGFGEVFAQAFAEKGHYAHYDFDDIGDIVIPGLKRLKYAYELCQLAMMIGDAKREDSHRIRLVPPLSPIAANDCEAPNA